MDPKQILDWTISYGLGIVLSILITLAFWKILIYVLKENKIREERLATLLETHIVKLIETVGVTNANIKDRDGYYKKLEEANEREQKEHIEMIKSLQALQLEIQRIR